MLVKNESIFLQYKQIKSQICIARSACVIHSCVMFMLGSIFSVVILRDDAQSKNMGKSLTPKSKNNTQI